MKQFQYSRAVHVKAALESFSRDKSSRFIGGGTNLIDLMKRGVESPERLVDISRLPLNTISSEEKTLQIGATALNSTVAENKLVLQKQPLLAMALNAGASAQIRNMATVGGNMLQRTRCHYFYDTALPCNKREPGSGCAAMDGFNRMHAIFGFSDKCIAVHPSDMSVALAALDASVLTEGMRGKRRILFNDLHRLPGDKPELDTNLMPGELITGIEIPDNSLDKHVYYLKVRDRASYAFALVSVAAALDIEKKEIRDVRLALGGVAHKPWRLSEVEQFLKGKTPSESLFREAANRAMTGAKAFKHNEFKLRLAPNSIVRALKVAAKLV